MVRTQIEIIDRGKLQSEVVMADVLAGRNIGMVLLGLWLILTGLLPLLNVNISGTVAMALGVLAIVAGILILIRR